MSEVADVEDEQKKIQIGTNKSDINIILLGETGVGKSTFINAIFNYLNYNTFENAQQEKIHVLVPFLLTLDFEDGKSRKIGVGLNEKLEGSNNKDFSTQDIRTYIFPIENNQTKLRVIDTPGMNGTKKDDVVLENILNYISNLQKLHAICFLFNPSKSKNIDYFEFWVQHFFPQIERSATKNVIFIFTKINDSDYNAGELLGFLKNSVDKIKKNCGIEIPLNRNSFYFENESFKYLFASKNSIDNMKLNENKARQSWKESTTECWRLIRYIRGGDGDKPLNPYNVKNTYPICRLRRMIAQLIEPLIDVTLLISYNLDVLQNHQNNLVKEEKGINEVVKNLYIPVINFDMITLHHPVTVCVACANVVKVQRINQWHFKQICHRPCYLTHIRADLVDDDQLKHCVAMDETKKCIKCICDYSKHRHIYYMTQIKQERIKDSNVLKNIESTEKIMEMKKQLINDINVRTNDLKNEHTCIVTNCAKIAHFLQQNALSPFKDQFEAYIDYLITREHSLKVSLCDKNTIHHLEMLLQQYQETKHFFNSTWEISKSLEATGNDISSKKIFDAIQSLFKLANFGKKISGLYDRQTAARMKEHSRTEYEITYFAEEEGKISVIERRKNKHYGSPNGQETSTSTISANVNRKSKSWRNRGTNKHSSSDCQNETQRQLYHSADQTHQPDYTTDTHHYFSGPQNNLLRPRNYSSGLRNYSSGPRNYSSGPRNYSPGPRNYSPDPQNYSLGPQNYPPAAHNFSSSSNNYPPGPHNYRTGSYNYLPSPNNYPPGSFNKQPSFSNNPGSQRDRHHYNHGEKNRRNNRGSRGTKYNERFMPKTQNKSIKSKTETDSSSESSSIDTSEPSD